MQPRAILLLFSLWCATALAWTPETFPHPQKNFEICGLKNAGHVCDPDRVLSDVSRNVVEGLTRDIESGVHPFVKVPCGSSERGFQVGVAIARTFGVGSDSEAQRAASAIHDQWRVGDAACDNGVLLMLAIDDRRMFISTGTAARQRLTDDMATHIVQRVAPKLKQQDYDSGVEKAVMDIGLALAHVPPHGSRHRGMFAWLWEDAIFYLVIAVFGAAAVFNFIMWRRRRNVMQILKRMQNDVENARTSCRYTTTTCPICFEDLATSSSSRDDATAASAPSSSADPFAGASAPVAPFDTSASAAAVEPAAAAAAAGTSGAAVGDGDGAATSIETPLLDNWLAGNDEGQQRDDDVDNTRAVKAAAAMRSTAPHNAAQRAPFRLPCGHVFCEPCVAKWMESNATCPICRKPVLDDGRTPQQPRTRPPPPACSAAQQARVDVMPELLFRWQLLRARYPGVLTREMQDAWMNDAAHQLHPVPQQTATSSAAASVPSTAPWTQFESLLQQQSARQEWASKGSSSSYHVSFGGGRSSGGGGGGSW